MSETRAVSCEGADPFALRVVGESMVPEFPDGCVIVAEPGGVIEDGRYVVAIHQSEAIFRQLVVAEGRRFLKPLNPAFPVLELGPGDSIRATVIQKSHQGARKRYY
jgi:SOS-response transcriptional repressor LexA